MSDSNQPAQPAYESVLRDLGLHALLVDATGRITYSNPGAESVLAAQPGGLKSLMLDSLFALRNPEWLCHEIRSSAREGRWTGEAVLCRRDGSECWTHIQAFQAPTVFGLTDTIMVCFEDISGNIELMSALMKRNEDLYQRNRELEIVNKVGRALLEDTDLDCRLATTLREAARTIGAGCGIVCIKDRGGKHLVLRGVCGLDTSVLASGLSIPIDGQSVTARTVRTGRAQIVEDITDEPDAMDAIPARLGVRSAFWVPLIANDEVIGCMALGEKGSTRVFTQDEVTLAEVLANSAAAAIRSALLAEDVEVSRTYWQRTFDSISDPILVVDRSGAVVRANAAVAARLRTTTFSLLGQACDRVIEGLRADQVGEVISSRQPANLGFVEIRGERCEAWASPLNREDGEADAAVIHVKPTSASRRIAA